MRQKKSAVHSVLALLLVLMLTVSLTPTVSFASASGSSSSWPKGPEINSGAAVVLDADTNTVLYEKNKDEQRYPASITKIMTALLVIENKSLTDTVTFGEEAVSEAIPGNARIDAKVGETMTVDDCLHALLLASANEVCTQLAIDIAGSVSAFADMMNERAAAIGCTGTHFTNPNGLHDPDHYTTAYDMALIMQEAIKNETFLKIESDLTYTIQPTNMTAEPRNLSNHHVMLFQSESQWGYKGAFAGKTGFTDEAHNTLVTAAKRNKVTLICVVLTCDNLDYINDTRTLLDFGFDNFHHPKIKVSKKEGVLGAISLPKDVKADSASYSESAGDNDSTIRTYTYEGHDVGTVTIQKGVTVSDSSDLTSDSSSSSSSSSSVEEKTTPTASSTVGSRIILAMIVVDALAFLLIIVLLIRRKNHRKRRDQRRRK